jgi:hypothetical protein
MNHFFGNLNATGHRETYFYRFNPAFSSMIKMGLIKRYIHFKWAYWFDRVYRVAFMFITF